MPKKPRSEKRTPRRVFYGSLLIGLALCLVILGFELSRRYPVPIRLEFVDEGGQVQERYVADTWQEWEVTYTSGQTERFRSDSPTIIQLEVVQGKEPAVLYVKFPTVLKVKLRTGMDYNVWIEGRFAVWNAWSEMLKSDPLVTVLADYRALGSESSLEPVTFDSSDEVGKEKFWELYIVFSGSPSIPSGKPVMNLVNSLSGKSSAFIQVVNSQLWTLYKVYDPGVIVRWPAFVMVSRKAAESPYALNFNWTPSITGTATFTWPTGIVTTTDTSVILQYWTLTGTRTVTLWKTVNATLAGPTTTVIQTIATSRPTGEKTTTEGKGVWGGLVAWLRSLMPAGFEDLWWVLGIILLVVAIVVLAVIIKVLKWGLGGKK